MDRDFIVCLSRQAKERTQGAFGGGAECGHDPISRLAQAAAVDTSPRMTRQSIECSVKIFLVALILTFAWTVWQVLVLVGWL